MARKNFVLDTLLEKGEVSWKPHGNSMVPKIHSGDQVVVKKVPASACRVGDAVYAKVKGTYYLHLLSAIDETHDRYQISNNHGHVNGWVNADAVYGVCVQVKDKIILSDTDLSKRLEPKKGTWCPLLNQVCEPPADWNEEFPFTCTKCKHLIKGLGG